MRDVENGLVTTLMMKNNDNNNKSGNKSEKSTMRNIINKLNDEKRSHRVKIEPKKKTKQKKYFWLLWANNGNYTMKRKTNENFF